MIVTETSTRQLILDRAKALAPYVIVVLLFAGGLYSLHRLLAPVDLRAVIQQVRGTSSGTLAIALAATFGGYAALVGYDWSALRYIGKKLPFRIVALGGFLGYAFGNTIGLSPISGGAVRYRIYSALGLGGYDIATIATFASLAFGFGVTMIGLASLALHPYALQAVAPFAPTTVRWAALAALGALLLLIGALALRGGSWRMGGFDFRLPSPSIMAGQVVFTAVDLVMAATVLYVLMPSSDLGFTTFLAIFAVATMAGVLSHVPGGIGVFESVMIAALPSAVSLEHAASALLMYRLIYYLVPFSLALALLALSEVGASAPALGGRLGKTAESLKPIFKAVSAVAPIAMSSLVFASGLWMLVSSLIPNMSDAADELELLLPLALVEGGALLSSAIGVVLIVVANGLVRRIDGAYWLAKGALVAGAFAALLHGVDYDRAIVLGFAAIILWSCRREFYRSARLTRTVFDPTWFALIGGVIMSGAFVLFFANKSTAYAYELWWQFAFDESAPRAMRAGLVASLALTAGLVFVALRPIRVRLAPPDRAALEAAAGIVASQANPDANLAFTGDKAFLFSDRSDAFIMYGVQGRSWVAFGDPIGARDGAVQAAWAFADAAAYAGARAVFYEVSEEYLPLWIDMGLKLHKLGEEAIVDLAEFDLAGGDRKRLRTSHNRAVKDGLTLDIAPPPHSPELLTRLRKISDAWLSGKHAREKGFSVGRFDTAYLDRFPLAIVSLNGASIAFANVMTTATKQSATIDLMRHAPNAPNGVMEFLFVELMLRLKADGYGKFSLGMAPLSGLEARRGVSLWTKFGAQLFHHGGHFYNFEGLRDFKDKFDPAWRPRYLACASALPPVAPLADVSILIAGGVKGLVSR